MKKGLIFLVFLVSVVFAGDELYKFPTPQQSQRFVQLTENFRCLVCQNQSIADSNAPLAIDLKKLVYHQILDEKSDDEIKNFMIERYGNFVVFEPPLSSHTFVLWFFPLILSLIGSLVAYAVVRKARSLP